jgi:fatty acid synthase subunit alpha, fungi type
MEVEELCNNLQTSGTFSGQLRQISTTLISRLFSLKMPGGFNLASARSYLADRWGLLAGRQDAVLLRASAVQPAARLASKADAEAFLDKVVEQYAKDISLNLAPSSSKPVAVTTVSSAVSDGSRVSVTVRGKELASITKNQEAWQRAKLETLSRHLKVDLRAGERAYGNLQKECEDLRRQLDILTSELGEVFVTGIQPLWSSTKVRRFDSYWNWALQDMLKVFYDVLLGHSSPNDDEVMNRSILIANRSNPRLLRAMRYMLAQSWAGKGRRIEEAKTALSRLVEICHETSSTSLKSFTSYTDIFSRAPKTFLDKQGRINYHEVSRSTFEGLPVFHLKTKGANQNWHGDERLSEMYHGLVDQLLRCGVSFKDKNILLTGASPGSIGAEVLRGLLSSGGRVIVTTSSYSSDVVRYYQQMYMDNGAKDSELIVIPFNQASQRDLDALAQYIYDPKSGLGWDLDHIVPFAAISEAGREVDGIDSKSELSHRIMLTNVLRLLGVIKKQKQDREYESRPAQVILPLSPNHGAFGGDGLYAESKISLETLFEKWHSESWAPYLSICGAAIGWTRGTGLMTGNDIVAAGIEKLGVRTFAQPEMAFYILVLMSKHIAVECDNGPIYADLTGGLNSISNLKPALTAIRHEINEAKSIHEAIANEEAFDKAMITGHQEASWAKDNIKPQPNIRFDFAKLPDYEAEVKPLALQLEDMVDLDRVVVVTGFSELGPWGNSRTRWEMEAFGKLSLEGCIEMAWIMGLIKNYDGQLSGNDYHGWVDAKTLKPINAADIKTTYESQILKHTGIRLIEGASDKRQLLQEIIVEEDLPPFSVPKEMAEQFHREHEDRVDIYGAESDEEMSVRFRKGAVLMLPKALEAGRRVVGQIPKGWDPRTYGIPEEIIAQVDPVTLYALITTVEALLASGITDPYELYKYIHISDIGNCIGSGFGGAQSLKKVFLTRYLDKPVQNDVLAECFINTTPAWINMLLLSSAGPIRTSVGACATSIESLETGVETIVSGRAKMCLVGGFDDLDEAVSLEFANMKATANAEQEFEKGRPAHEMSRPTSSSRSGFVESQGSGVQVITSARLALDMGLPIYGVIALATTASDKIGRSVPAPGNGILTNASEKPANFPSPLLDIQYRRRRLKLRREEIKKCLDVELDLIEEELALLPGTNNFNDSSDLERLYNRREYVKREAVQLERATLDVFGNSFWKGNPHISPIRGALAVWGLTVDDIDIASFHGTSTRLNDINEAQVIQEQLSHLGRKRGNVVLGICQKYLTGHSKGAAGAWMLNGCLQVLNSGIVPGNRNADNIDAKLEESDLLVFPNRTIQTAGIKAFSLTSFGFGQKGAQAIGVHPRYLFATIKKDEYDSYKSKVAARYRTASRFFQNALATNTMFVAKNRAPYSDGQGSSILLNPEARVSLNPSNELLYMDDLVDKIM